MLLQPTPTNKNLLHLPFDKKWDEKYDSVQMYNQKYIFPLVFECVFSVIAW